jgi:hypothetical protein
MIHLLRAIAFAILSGQMREMEDWLDWRDNQK